MEGQFLRWEALREKRGTAAYLKRVCPMMRAESQAGDKSTGMTSHKG